ncbi:lipopolysaccharide biosynthesis protein [Streptomyces sp. NPDC058001]|uniref:lipopolysaccharide biosynthesis protein n=1 Tax=Streptomyces sp. NPDC058001 TaxID=3346300 RepID=UPI0036ED31BC
MTENPSRRPRRPGRPAARVWSRAHRFPTWSVLPVCALAGALAGGTYGVVKTPEYTATSYVIAVPTEKSDPATALGFAQAYGRAATQLAVLGDAQVWAGVPVGTLRDSVRASTSPDAPMVAISATAPRPAQAADIANAVSRALTINANQTVRNTRVQLLQFSRAVKPSAPSSTSAPVTALVGGCAGALIGGLALLVRPRRRIPDDLPATVPNPAPAADLQR